MALGKTFIRQITGYTWCVSLLACASPHEELPDAEMSAANREALRQVADSTDFVDAKGRRWLRVRKVTTFAPEPTREFSHRDGPSPDLENLSLDELAEALRPVAFANGVPRNRHTTLQPASSRRVLKLLRESRTLSRTKRIPVPHLRHRLTGTLLRKPSSLPMVGQASERTRLSRTVRSSFSQMPI
jgi:hypothetical protein